MPHTNFKDLKNQRFGRLSVVDDGGRTPKGKARWICRCDCGEQVLVLAYLLRSGQTKSCGCLKMERIREANARKSLSATGLKPLPPEFSTWNGMKRRCLNSSDKRFKDYGGRGIKVCERWRSSFASFLEDMGKKPSPDHSLDRIDNNGNYEPGNCRWATKIQQARNRRTNRLIDGSRTISEIAEEAGLHPSVLRTRIFQLGWSLQRAIETPLMPNIKKD